MKEIFRKMVHTDQELRKRPFNKMLSFTLFIVVLDPFAKRRANLHMNKKRNLWWFKWYRVVWVVFPLSGGGGGVGGCVRLQAGYLILKGKGGRQQFTGEKCPRMLWKKWHVIYFGQYDWLRGKNTLEMLLRWKKRWQLFLAVTALQFLATVRDQKLFWSKFGRRCVL